MSWDVIMVGGGLGGLMAAALLARAGRRVLVLERRPVLGGRGMVVRQGGFILNYGYHFITGAGLSPHWRVLRRIGREVPAVPTHMGRFYQYRRGGLHRFPAPPLEMWRTRLFPWPARLDYARSGLRLLLDRPEDWDGVPLGRYLAERVRTPEARQFHLDIARAISFDPEPEALSAGHWLRVFQLVTRTGPRPSYVLAWDRIFDALAATVREAGGEVRLKARVDRVELGAGGVTGIRTGGELLTAGAYVVAVPVQELPAILTDGFPGWTPGRMQAVVPTAGVSLDLGVEGDWHRYATVDVPEENVTPGHTLFQAMCFLTPAEVQDPARVEAARGRILAVMDRFWPGARQRTVLERWLVRPVLTGARRRWDQPWRDLLPVAPPGVPNLYFCGDTAAAPGPLSNAAVESAEAVADRILRPGAAG